MGVGILFWSKTRCAKAMIERLLRVEGFVGVTAVQRRQLGEERRGEGDRVSFAVITFRYKIVQSKSKQNRLNQSRRSSLFYCHHMLLPRGESL